MQSLNRLFLVSLVVVGIVCALSVSAAVPAPAARGHAPALFGTIVSVDAVAGNVVIATAARHSTPSQQVTVATDANTVITLDGQPATLAALVAGMLVKVQPTTGTATLIAARTPPPPPPLRGVIVSVDTTTGDVQVAVDARHSEPTLLVTVPTDANTVVTLDGQPSTLAALAAGMFVKVQPSTGVAVSIDARTPPAPAPLEGVIVNVDSATGDVVVATRGRHSGPDVQVTVFTDSNTLVTIDGNAATVPDLQAGMFVKVQPPSGTATSIEARTPPPPPPLVGVIVSVDAATGNVVVATGGGRHDPAQQVTVATDANTVVTIDGNAATVAALLPGMSVKVQPRSGTAASIEAQTQPLLGIVVSVDTVTGNVVVASRNNRMTPVQQVTVATDANTVVTIDGNAATVADLKAGMFVKISPSTGTAATIVAHTVPGPHSM